MNIENDLEERGRKLMEKEMPKLQKLLGRFQDKIELAEEFLKIQPMHFDENRIWWIWNKKEFRWIRIDETSVLNFIRTIAPEENTITYKDNILEALRQVSRENKPEKPKESWIQFKSKIIDIATDEEIPASSKYFISNPIGWDLGTSEETPTIDNLFISWVDEEHKEELYELLAFCLVPSYFIHRLFCLIGSGSNGKSTFQKVLDKFIGEENETSSSLNLLLKERFEGSKLFKKLVCLIGETNFNLISNTDFLKKATGEDMIRCEFKGKDGFDFRNYSKIIMATNSIPPTADKTDGFYRRWKIIDFYHKFNIEKDVFSEIKEEEFQNLALKCLKIAKRLWKHRTFTNDGDFEHRKQRYEDKSNPLNKFIKEYYEKNVQGETFYSDFYDSLNIYLEERGFRTLSSVAVSRQLKNEGFDVKTITKGEKNGRFIIGLKLKINGVNGINGFSTQCSLTRVSEKRVNMVNSVNSSLNQSRNIDSYTDSIASKKNEEIEPKIDEKSDEKAENNQCVESESDSIAKRKFSEEDEERDFDFSLEDDE